MCIPFEDIYTSIFLLEDNENSILLDCGTNDVDVSKYIIPAIESMNMRPDFIICSHLHGDHCGGIESLAKEYPSADIGFISDNKSYKFTNSFVKLRNNDILFNRFKILNLSGHTNDCLAILDLKNNTLLSCDCLQQHGVSHYGISITDYNGYINSIHLLKKLKIDCIICSHDYVPLGAIFDGNCNVLKCLNECEKIIDEIKEFVISEKAKTLSEITVKYNYLNNNLPDVPQTTINAVSIKKELN